jgi:hypothetical protein
MADVNISKYRAQVVREGSTPASPGFVVSEGQNPVDPSGSGQTHLPVTIAAASTGLSITESQVLGGAGTVAQYIRGDGSLADFPESSGGGSSVSYYLNGSVSQGTIGGVAYLEMNKVPILGAGTDFTRNSNGYIASFITDAGDPNLLEIPGGNWNFESYFSASSGGGSPTFYVELYKVNAGGTATLIASNSANPELISFGTTIAPYFSSLAVPTTVLALTDRLAVRYYVTPSGRTLTLHTEGPHLCQIITTFTTGITALNGLTSQVQFFAVGTSGTDFNIASATATHTFNLPTASAANRGALSAADWTTFNSKENAITAGTTAQYYRGDKTFQTLNTAAVPELTNLYYTEARVNANTNVAANTAARHAAVTLGTANGLSLSTQQLSLGLASAGVTGALSGTDWSTFNSKQQALNGTGFVKISGTTISYDNSTYLTTASAASTYLPLTGGTLSGTLNGTVGNFSINVTAQSLTTNRPSLTTSNPFLWTTAGTADWFLGSSPTGISTSDLSLYSYGTSSVVLNIVKSTGAATFSSSVTGSAFIPSGSTIPTNGMYLPSANTIAFSTNTTERIHITSFGDVGIGTNNPTEKLHINGGSSTTFLKLTGQSRNMFIGQNLLGLDITQEANADMVFATNATYRMRINAGGNVWIGNFGTDTGDKLRVVGTTFTDNIKTLAPTGTNNEIWRLGRALLATSSDPEDRWIRVQLGTKIYDILAIDRGNA